MNTEKLQDLKEKWIVIGVFMGLFLPVRLVFYTYVSQYWLGSFGVITGIAILVFYLSWKGKLGAFGRIWKRQIVKMARGKLGLFLIVEGIIAVTVYSGYVYFIEEGKTEFSNDVEIMDQYMEEQGVTAIDVFDPTKAGDSTGRGAEAMIIALMALMSDPDKQDAFIDELSDPKKLHYVLSIALASADNLLGGWLLHFNIVFLIEQAEQVILVIYFRYFFKGKVEEIFDKK